ncbi:MAG: hypothetical protein Kow00104_16020 [Rhodothalassiaceae bacterium]
MGLGEGGTAILFAGARDAAQIMLGFGGKIASCRRHVKGKAVRGETFRWRSLLPGPVFTFGAGTLPVRFDRDFGQVARFLRYGRKGLQK